MADVTVPRSIHLSLRGRWVRIFSYMLVMISPSSVSPTRLSPAFSTQRKSGNLGTMHIRVSALCHTLLLLGIHLKAPTTFGVHAQGTQEQPLAKLDNPTLPLTHQCETQCLTSTINKYSCLDIKNATCICNTAGFYGILTECAIQRCPEADSGQVATRIGQFIQAQCTEFAKGMYVTETRPPSVYGSFQSSASARPKSEFPPSSDTSIPSKPIPTTMPTAVSPSFSITGLATTTLPTETINDNTGHVTTVDVTASVTGTLLTESAADNGVRQFLSYGATWQSQWSIVAWMAAYAVGI
ncbi:hypothetical protein C8Q78DRAFT_1056033 [Trametes maxima]|nr:hypothetical protein C8Q78DRAFT_1056033 [Trametes maxima]